MTRFRPLEHPTVSVCEHESGCAQVATHLRIDTAPIPGGVMNTLRLMCPGHAGAAPLPGDTVTNLDGEHGLVVGYVVDWPTAATVPVEWEGRTEPEAVDMLDTEYGTCSHGGDDSSKCRADTAPGEQFCRWHGGADPLPIPVRYVHVRTH